MNTIAIQTNPPSQKPLSEILSDTEKAIAEATDPTLAELLSNFREQLERQQKENFLALSAIVNKINRINAAIK